MKVSSISGFVICGALVLSSTGCKKLLSGLQKGGDGGSQASADADGGGAEVADADEALQEKISGYIDCLNNVSSRITDARERYYFYIDKKLGPVKAGLKIEQPSLYEIPQANVDKCKAGVAKAQKLPPSDPKLEALAAEYVAAAIEITPLDNEAKKYCEHKDYKDDAWAKGKALHPKIVAGFDRFRKANLDFNAAIDAIAEGLDDRVLVKIEKHEGKKFAYLRKRTMIAGRKLINSVDASPDDHTFDGAGIGTRFTTFETALADLSTYGKAHIGELKSDAKPRPPSWPMAESNYGSFMSAAEEYSKASKTLFRCFRDAPATAKTKAGRIDPNKLKDCGSDGELEKVMDAMLDKYNRLIDTSNRSHFP